MDDRRARLDQSHVVETGIFIAEFATLAEGARYLARHGIDIRIARRVLLTPAMRRKGHA